jgi:hypothetical protein
VEPFRTWASQCATALASIGGEPRAHQNVVAVIADCHHRRVDFDIGPFGSTAAEAAAFVSAEIRRYLPPGWRLDGLGGVGDPNLSPMVSDRHPLIGDIVESDHDPQSIYGGGYGVEITSGLDLLIFTWGNSDAGPGTVETAMAQAMVIRAPMLRIFGMQACIGRLFKLPQNVFGLT